MTMEFRCGRCNKRFYVTGTAERALNDLVDAATLLTFEGYKNLGIGAWRVVQKRAKCCSNPSIIIVKWKC